ncbi:MAG: acetyl xylan esterase, partial [Paenibacillus sp.]|nr:acetyl xylan esterase [Paenibacillus sp.]
MEKRQMAAVPDILRMQDGAPVTTKEQWEQARRPEIVSLFRQHVYGTEPVQRPEGLSFTVETTDGMMGGTARRKRVRIQYDAPRGKGEFELLLFVPQQATKPSPAFLMINNRGKQHADREAEGMTQFWSAELIVSLGYAAAIFQVGDIDPDNYDDFRDGVHGLFDPERGEGEARPGDAWGTIAAWAWGASRAMDYLVSDEQIDSGKVAVVGHSRGGKTALWAGALDERFAMVVSNNSGCTGAAVSRGKQGETVKAINTKFPHWFAGNYSLYNDREEELPVDQHMLLASIAPRLLYVASATEDAWADPQG